MEHLFKRTSWVVTGPLLLGTVLYFALVYVPGEKAIADMRRELDSITDLVYQLESQGTRIEAIRAALNSTEEFSEHRSQEALSHQHASEFYARLSEMARDTGVQIRALDPDSITLYESLEVLPVNLMLSGSFAAIFDFTAQLESLPLIVWIDKLTLQAPRQTGEDTQAELVLKVFGSRSQESD